MAYALLSYVEQASRMCCLIRCVSAAEVQPNEEHGTEGGREKGQDK